jgi:16S rRNA (guanine1207-N2)-methyltransferase
VAVILGAPGRVTRLIAGFDTSEVTCFQLDVYQAGRLREELSRRSLSGTVVAAPDLWDIGNEFQTAVYPASFGGERSLKRDMVEQAFHVLRPHGKLVVFSPYESDDFFPGVLKKIFGRAHAAQVDRGSVLWSVRDKDRARRRHEMTFPVRLADGQKLRLLSRPGVFSYGRLDDGARALLETMRIGPGDQILDMGCGCGVNGIAAARQGGQGTRVLFVDSNTRALAVAAHNADANEIGPYQSVLATEIHGIAPASCHVALANPPYYAQLSIARTFIDQCRMLLRPGGTLYLVTKKSADVEPMIADQFPHLEVVNRRGYAVFCVSAPHPGATWPHDSPDR